MEFVIVTNNKGNAKYYFYMHKRGCKNISLEEKRFSGHTFIIDGENVEDAIRNQLIEFHKMDQGYGREDFLVSNCLK